MNEQKEVELEQYKIFIESTEKNSDRRINQNNIYLTINLAFVSYICTQNLDFKHNLVVLIVGLIICAIWFLTIVNYSKRNKVKFDIINENYNWYTKKVLGQTKEDIPWLKDVGMCFDHFVRMWNKFTKDE